MEIILTEQNFEQEVLKSDLPVLVDFWATWCGPCKMIAPIIEDLAKELEGKVKVGKVNVDEQMGLAIRYTVEAIPTLIFFKNGEIVKKSVGLLDKNEILQIIATL